MTKTNETGILPTEFKVLIAPKEVGDKIGSIYLPDSTKERDQFAQMEGTLVAVSPLAFTYAKQEEWEAAGAAPPTVGDRVLFAKYAGAVVKSLKDGKDYRLVNDKDIAAVLS